MPFPFSPREDGAVSDLQELKLLLCQLGVGSHQVPPSPLTNCTRARCPCCSIIFNNILLIPKAEIAHLFLSVVLFDGLNSRIMIPLHRELEGSALPEQRYLLLTASGQLNPHRSSPESCTLSSLRTQNTLEQKTSISLGKYFPSISLPIIFPLMVLSIRSFFFFPI